MKESTTAAATTAHPGNVSTPELKGFDHVHVYVSSRADAERWYGTVLGLRRVEALMQWAVEGGPLTLEDPAGQVHLAVFEREDPPRSTAIAFGATGKGFLAWKAHLERHSVELRVTDHALAYSLYFHDPDGNLYEITTYEHAYVRLRVGSSQPQQQ